MCATQSFVSACRSALSGHSYYRTHEQDIHIAHIEDSGQTVLSDMNLLDTHANLLRCSL